MEERLEQLEQEIQQLKQQIRELPEQHRRQQLELQHQLYQIDPQNQQRQLQLLQQSQQRELPELQQLLREREEEQVQLQRLQMRRLPIITEADKKTHKESAMFGEVHNGMNTESDAAAMELIAEDESKGPYQFGYYPVSSSESESESESRKKPTRKLPPSSLSRLDNFRNFGKSAKKTLKRGANAALAGVNASIIASKAVSDGVRLARRSQKYQDARADLSNADVHPDLRAKPTFGQYPLEKSDVIRSLGPRAIEKFLAPNLDNSKKVTNVLDLNFNRILYFIWVITTDGERIKIPIFAYPVESVMEVTTKPFTFARAMDLAFYPYVYRDGKFYAEATNARSMLDLNRRTS